MYCSLYYCSSLFFSFCGQRYALFSVPPNVWRIFSLFFLNTEARRHGEDIFKFSEETENLKTPWLCGYILHFLFWDAAYCRSLLYVRPLKNPAGRDLAGRVDFNYALCLRTDSFYNSPCCLLQRFPLGVKAKMMKIMQGTATTANTM